MKLKENEFKELPKKVQKLLAEISACEVEFSRLKRRLDIEDNKIDRRRAKLKKTCTHPPNLIKRHRNYFPGSYYDTETFVTRYVCKVCGALVKEERQSGGYG